MARAANETHWRLSHVDYALLQHDRVAAVKVCYVVLSKMCVRKKPCLQAKYPADIFDARLFECSTSIQAALAHLMKHASNEPPDLRFRYRLLPFSKLIEQIEKSVVQLRIALTARADIEQDAIFA